MSLLMRFRGRLGTLGLGWKSTFLRLADIGVKDAIFLCRKRKRGGETVDQWHILFWTWVLAFCSFFPFALIRGSPTQTARYPPLLYFPFR